MSGKLIIDSTGNEVWQEDNMEYKRLEFKDSRSGRRKLEREVNSLAKQGWRVVDSETKNGSFGVIKTTALGVLFLPLALKGRKKGKINVMLERPTK